MAMLDDAVVFANNPEPRNACLLLLDTSGSMGGAPIDELNDGLTLFRDEVTQDALASKRVEVAIVTFGGVVSLVQDFVTIDRFSPPHLTASGGTPMGEALVTGLQMIKARKQTYKDNGITYFRPWVFLITDGEPTDDLAHAATLLQREEAGKGVEFFAVAVGQGGLAAMPALSGLSSKPPVALNGLQFRQLFKWLSDSSKAVSRSKPGDQVALPPPGWAAVTV
jgi:uncharacterized protein YegL